MSSRAQQKAEAREAREAAERAEAQRAARRRRLTVLGGLLAAAAAIVLVAVLVSQAGTEEAPPTDEAVAALSGIPQDGAWLGAVDAPVVVEEYADLQCPFCAQFALRDLPGIVDERVRTGEVRLRSRLLTFLGPDSIEAGRLAAAAGMQDREWQFTKAFFGRQGQENSGYVDEAFLREVAEATPGLDVDRAFSDRAGAEVTRRLQEDARAAADGSVQSTPTFLVGPRGGDLEAVTAEGLPAAIEQALGA
jgi:protein-disulfide isomerase